MSSNVVVVASEALHNLWEVSAARSGFKSVLQTSNEFARTHVLNAIDSVEKNSPEIRQSVIEMAQRAEVLTRQLYDHWAAKVLMYKWGISAEDHEIEVTW